jgi:hypothetical protein
MVPPASSRLADLSTFPIHQSRPSIHDFAQLCASVVDNVWKLASGMLARGERFEYVRKLRP